MNKFLLSAVIGALVVTGVVISHSSCTHSSVSRSHVDYANLAVQYLNFLGTIGAANAAGFSSQLQTLVAQEVTKSMNGKVIVNNAAELDAQLKAAKDAYKSWMISFDSSAIIVDESNETVALPYKIYPEGQGSNIVFVFLKFKGKEIISIDEVYNVLAV